MTTATENGSPATFEPKSIKRPDESLARYYGLVSLLSGPFFPIAFTPLYFKYITLRYMSRLGQSRTAGLGDEDLNGRSSAWSSEQVATLREIRDLLAAST